LAALILDPGGRQRKTNIGSAFRNRSENLNHSITRMNELTEKQEVQLGESFGETEAGEA
jgi:hypothetical protein